MQVQNIVGKAAETAGIQETLYTNAAGQPINRITPHAFRHGHAVKLLKDGVPTRFVQEHLGHADLSTTEHYLQVIESDVKDSIHDNWTETSEHS